MMVPWDPFSFPSAQYPFARPNVNTTQSDGDKGLVDWLGP